MSPMFAFACRRPAQLAVVRRLTVLCLASAMLGTGLLLPPGPAAAQPSKPAKRAEIHGTPQLKWQPANVTIAPGGTVTFKIVGATPHPVGSGSAPPNDDGRFDTAGCQADQLSGDGASCTVRFQKAGTYRTSVRCTTPRAWSAPSPSAAPPRAPRPPPRRPVPPR